MLVTMKSKISMKQNKATTSPGESAKEKPNPNTGGTDRGMTENAGKVPGTRPGNHA